MRRRAYILGALTLGIVAAQSGPSFCRVLTSARNVHEYFETLDQSPAELNTVERFVFSLMLANTGEKEKGAAVARRTS